LALIVRLEQPFLADVGFGNGTLIPIPLCEGPHNDTRFDFRLSRDGDWWRFHNHRHDGSTYDFKEIPVALETFAAQNRSLASDADSSFVRNLVCMRMTEDGMVALTNTVFQHYSATELKEETAPNAARFAEILHEFFDLSVDPIEPLWERASAQRKDWLRKKLRGF
jgi:N-hydroxyarylamine O-acetyltransferase